MSTPRNYDSRRLAARYAQHRAARATIDRWVNRGITLIGVLVVCGLIGRASIIWG